MVRQYYVYIITNSRKTVLYTGVTSDLARRVWQHRNGQGGGFTGRYHCSKLVLYEIFQDSYNAIAREKQIKAGSRRSKVELIERMNPEWRDLYDEVIARGPESLRGRGAPEAIQPTREAAGLPSGPADRSQ
jgi:putative endonuclease